MKEIALEFSFKARYYQAGNLDKNTKQVWFVLHGYGYLARYFLKKFELLEQHNICVIAPEGLSRFYLEPVEKRAITGNNRVGATWMTSENRLTDIENYLLYLDTVYLKVMENQNFPVTFLGFSQGAVTATRWAINTKLKFDRLILWSGIWPPDMDFKKGNDILAAKNVALVYGTQDPFINDSRLDEMNSLTEKLGIKPSVTPFNGGHDIEAATLLTFA